jgi:CRP-like cAMP-binding protein
MIHALTLAWICERGSLSKYRKDQIVFSQGQVADAVFYIQQGKIKLAVISEQGKEAVVATRALSSADVNSRRADAHHNP